MANIKLIKKTITLVVYIYHEASSIQMAFDICWFMENIDFYYKINLLYMFIYINILTKIPQLCFDL